MVFMKKWIVFFTLIICLSFQSNIKAQVIWDGAEITKGQTGKLTFSKDVKIYKKMLMARSPHSLSRKENFIVYTAMSIRLLAKYTR